jgi:hypothetical protein
VIEIGDLTVTRKRCLLRRVRDHDAVEVIAARWHGNGNSGRYAGAAPRYQYAPGR